MKKREQLEKLQVLFVDTYRDSILEMQEIASTTRHSLTASGKLLNDNDVISITEKSTLIGNLAGAFRSMIQT